VLLPTETPKSAIIIVKIMHQEVGAKAGAGDRSRKLPINGMILHFHWCSSLFLGISVDPTKIWHAMETLHMPTLIGIAVVDVALGVAVAANCRCRPLS
jgi:hypothetical protein